MTGNGEKKTNQRKKSKITPKTTVPAITSIVLSFILNKLIVLFVHI